VSGNPFSNAYTYDAGSNRRSLTAPDGSITTYGYDALNRLNGIANSWAGSFGFGYDALSRRTSLTRPNGVNTNYSYDSVSHLLSVLHQTGSITLDGASYVYDSAGNPASKTNYLSGITEGYAYDPIYQLTQVTQGASTTESYSYDAVGNRLSSSGMPTYTYNSSNELTANSSGSYTYDANGNTLSDPSGKQYTWDFENRLVQAVVPGANGGTTTFKYDPFGRRIQKFGPLGTTNYLYDGPDVAEEVNSSGGAIAVYTLTDDLDEPMAVLVNSTPNYYETDGLGSVTSLSNAAGALVRTYTFDSFGNQTSSSGSLPNSFQYTARQFDSETALYYYRARYYDPQQGRFLVEDPLGPKKEGPNLYRYVSNNPIVNVDPLGKYQIEKSCKDHPCIMIGGGGPNRPNEPPHQANVADLIKQEADAECSNTSGIANPRLRACIQKRCKSGKIKCSDNCPQSNPQAGNAPYYGSTATLCLDPIGTPPWTTPEFFGGTIIHEWAHTCRWKHGQGGGIPHDPGPDKP